VIAVDDALQDLASIDAEQARLVELRFYGGMNGGRNRAADGNLGSPCAPRAANRYGLAPPADHRTWKRMSPEVHRLFEAAVELPTDQRVEYLESQATEPEVRRAVLALLAHADLAEPFFAHVFVRPRHDLWRSRSSAGDSRGGVHDRAHVGSWGDGRGLFGGADRRGFEQTVANQKSFNRRIRTLDCWSDFSKNGKSWRVSIIRISLGCWMGERRRPGSPHFVWSMCPEKRWTGTAIVTHMT